MPSGFGGLKFDQCRAFPPRVLLRFSSTIAAEGCIYFAVLLGCILRLVEFLSARRQG